MMSSKKNSHKRKNDLDKRGKYQKFGDTCIQMREPVIKSYAEKVITHAASNGGSCHWGFVKDLVERDAKVAPFMRITCNDINNKVRAIQGQGSHECEQEEVSGQIRTTGRLRRRLCEFAHARHVITNKQSLIHLTANPIQL
jgi:hypothetical protein